MSGLQPAAGQGRVEAAAGQSKRVVAQTVKSIRPLPADGEFESFFECERPAEVDVLLRHTESTVIADGAVVVCPLAVICVHPGRRIEDLRGLGIETLAVDVKRLGMDLTVQIDPVDGPRRNDIPAGIPSLVRAYCAAIEVVVDGIRTARTRVPVTTGPAGNSRGALILQEPARAPVGEDIRIVFPNCLSAGTRLASLCRASKSTLGRTSV